MADSSRKRFRRTTIIYWTLLVYIVAALVWWFISLNAQNNKMRDLEISKLQSDPAFTAHTVKYEQAYDIIIKEHHRNKAKYLGEGGLFFLLIMIGAAVVFRYVRQQLIMQQQQQNFMMAVTHELKTPISVAKLNLETIQKYALDAARQKKLIRMTLQETSRLDFLTNNILVASEMEGRGYKSSKEDLNLSDLLKDCLQEFRNRHTDRVFNEKIEPDAEVKGDALLLQMLINNLLENAAKYSPRDNPVTATLHKEKGVVVLQIMDEGPGIPDEEKKKVFDKFYRIGNENTRKTQGTGLGLYLCRKIAQDHKADISVTNNNPRGSNFTVTIHT
ncbi:MAG TPA: ATP-binding protein [Chitinophagaceae bacterium]|nr:ATP-binding protein [Chitinophagaceae bacterium]